MPDSFQYDVFLSYSSEDRATVHALAEQLRDAGLRVWLDAWVIRPGDMIGLEIQRGLEQSRVLVLCMSEAYFASEWATAESQSVLFRDPTNEQRRFIPLRLDDVKVPDLLAQFSYLDWRDPASTDLQVLAEACQEDSGMRTQGEQDVPRIRARKAIFSRRPASSIAVSGDGRSVFVGRETGTVGVWDLKKERWTAELRVHNNSVKSVAMSGDGRWGLVGGGDGTVRMLDLARATCIAVLKGHSHVVRGVAMSEDGRWGFSGGDDGTVQLWNLERRTHTVFQSHNGSVKDVAMSADGRRGLSGGGDRAVRVWDLRRGAHMVTLNGHSDWIRSVAISGDGRRGLSGSDDGTVRVWDLEEEACSAVLEGHSGWVRSVAISGDGRRGLSGSDDGTVRVWDLEEEACLAVLEGHNYRLLSVAVSANGQWGVSGSEDKKFRLWDLSVFDKAVPTSSQTKYTNAKVALIGESGVGKSGLRIRLTENDWRETDSTHGMAVKRLDLPGIEATDTEREVWLWDFAGQPDYRLIHQLYMDETALALFVIDPQRDDPFEPLGHWEKALAAAVKHDPARVLVAARCDRGGFTVSAQAIEEYLSARGYAEHLETAAKTGEGCDDLLRSIAEHIPWDRLPYVSTTHLFKALKDAILVMRGEDHALLRVAALQQRLRLELPDTTFDERELRQVIRLLEGQGLIRALPFGDFVLLCPELINSYASAVVRDARNHTDEIGSVAERAVLEATIPMDGVDRLDPTDEAILLRALVDLFLDRALCLREETEAGTQLVFPSYFRRTRPVAPERPNVVVTYRFSGPLDEIYATLVVRLHYTEAFEKDRFWQYAADFTTPSGHLAGLYLTKLEEGRAEIKVHFDEAVPADVQVTFIQYVHKHLQAKARDIERVRAYVCGECGEPLDPERTKGALNRGRTFVRCDEGVCDAKNELMDLIEEKFGSPEVLQAVRRMDEEAQIHLDNESRELILVGQAISISAEAGQIFRPTSLADHGIDGEIEFKVKGEASGTRVYLQLKSGDSYLYDRKRDQTQVFTIKKPRHAEYWLSQPCPVMLVIRTSDGVIRWMNVTEYLEEHGPDTKQIVFNGEPFTATSVIALRNQLLPPGHA